MQKIIPHLWFDKEVKEATALYTSLFSDSSIDSIKTITGTPSGDCDIVSFTLSGQEFQAISAGPYFKFNPSVSFFAVFEDEATIEKVWNGLIDGGKALMEYGTYPWAKKYGWLQDKYGVSWQLSWSEYHDMKAPITPALMFTKSVAGKAQEAIDTYTSIFPHSSIDMVSTYAEGEGDTVGFIKHARFTLEGRSFIAMDSSQSHDFMFNEAVSFVVNCETQEEVDRYWNALSVVPEAEQCGWCKDKFGVSWQIVPTILGKLMGDPDAEKANRVTKAMLGMKKLDIAALQAAYDQA